MFSTLNETLIALASIVINNGEESGTMICQEYGEIGHILTLEDGYISVDERHKRNDPKTYLILHWRPASGREIDLSQATKELADELYAKASKLVIERALKSVAKTA